jgi:murein DD-endopeptidase MepM/ murein hydrolase activator NlpD
MHHGIDYGGSFDVLAAGDGIVDHVGYSRTGGGHVVIIKHANDLYTVYYHGAHATRLKKGERVKAGQFLYRSGNTGSSNGVHLHFETRLSRRWGHTRDPQIYLTGSVPHVSTGPLAYKVTVPVDGRESKVTWKGWQTALKARWNFTGVLDGVPRRMTWTAVQLFAGKHYTGKVDGLPGPATRRAVQSKLKELGLYAGAIDGVWGRGTWSSIQRGLNAGVM